MKRRRRHICENGDSKMVVRYEIGKTRFVLTLAVRRQRYVISFCNLRPHLAALNKKTLPRGQEGSPRVRSLCADNVCRLEAFGALQQIKLHGLTLVECAVSILLYRGEVHEYVLTRGALDKSISLRPVEPLHSTFLSHGYYSFHHREELFAGLSDRAPVDWSPPQTSR